MRVRVCGRSLSSHSHAPRCTMRPSDSLPTIREMRGCLSAVDSPAPVIASLQRSFRERLLRVGVSSPIIIHLYVCAIHVSGPVWRCGCACTSARACVCDPREWPGVEVWLCVHKRARVCVRSACVAQCGRMVVAGWGRSVWHLCHALHTGPFAHTRARRCWSSTQRAC